MYARRDSSREKPTENEEERKRKSVRKRDNTMKKSGGAESEIKRQKDKNPEESR